MGSHIVELASTIASNTHKISSYLEENQKPFPSFGADGPPTLDIEAEDVEHIRYKTIDALQELLDLIQGPSACMAPIYNATSLQVIHRHDIARKVPVDGMVSFEDLAGLCDIRPEDMRRLIRYSISFHRLFNEPKEGFVGHSAGSLMLAKDELSRAAFEQRYDDFYPAFSRTAEALDMYKDNEPNHTGFALAHGIKDSMFDYLLARPEKREQFAKAMKCYARDDHGSSVSFLVQGYDWHSLGAGTLVDCGGSDGYVSMEISKAHPGLKIIVQDLPGVVKHAEESRETRCVPSIIQFLAHDIFAPQDTVAEAYLFRWIFHDWPDHYVVRALKNLVPAMKFGAKVIVNESLALRPGTLPLTIERLVYAMDLYMLSANNARLRTLEEWQKLFTEADARFGTIKCSIPDGAALAILQATWQE